MRLYLTTLNTDCNKRMLDSVSYKPRIYHLGNFSITHDTVQEKMNKKYLHEERVGSVHMEYPIQIAIKNNTTHELFHYIDLAIEYADKWIFIEIKPRVNLRHYLFQYQGAMFLLNNNKELFDGKPFEYWVYSYKTLKMYKRLNYDKSWFIDKLRTKVKAIESSDMSLLPSSSCKFCRYACEFNPNEEKTEQLYDELAEILIKGVTS